MTTSSFLHCAQRSGKRSMAAFAFLLATIFAAPLHAAIRLPHGRVAKNVCDPMSYGAKADGKSKDTLALQKAIDACASKGGGTVPLKSGTFLTAPLQLKSNITLNISAGVTLLGSPDHPDYPEAEVFRETAVQSLLHAEHASNIHITGGGTIDGNGASWWKIVNGRKERHQMAVTLRPRLLVFDHCDHIVLDHLNVRNSASWQIIPYYSNDVSIHDIQVTAPANSPNTDGIDPFSSHNVRISHVSIDTGDDNIAIKSGQPKSPGSDDPSTDISITDSTFLHGHGMSIGSEISGGVQNVRVARIHFENTRQGIRVKCQRDRGGNIGNFDFRDLTMQNVDTPIVVSEYYSGRPKQDTAQPLTRLTPHFHDIHISNLTATGARTAGVIIGLPESPILRLTLRNVHIEAQKGMTIANATVAAHDLVVKAVTGPAFIFQENGVLHNR